MARRAMLVLATALLALEIVASRSGAGAGARAAGQVRHVSHVHRCSSARNGSRQPAGGEHPVVVSEALSNPNLELKLYGPTGKEILMTGSAQDETIRFTSGPACARRRAPSRCARRTTTPT